MRLLSLIVLLAASTLGAQDSTRTFRGWEYGVRTGYVGGGSVTVAPNYPLSGETVGYSNDKCFRTCSYHVGGGPAVGAWLEFTRDDVTSIGFSLDSYSVGDGRLTGGGFGANVRPSTSAVQLGNLGFTLKHLVHWPSRELMLRPGFAVGVAMLPGFGPAGFSRQVSGAATLELLHASQPWVVEVGRTLSFGEAPSSDRATRDAIDVRGRNFARVGLRARSPRPFGAKHPEGPRPRGLPVPYRGWEYGVRAGYVSGGEVRLQPLPWVECCNYHTASGLALGAWAERTSGDAMSIGLSLDSYRAMSDPRLSNVPPYSGESVSLPLTNVSLTLKRRFQLPTRNLVLRPGFGLGYGFLPGAGDIGPTRHFITTVSAELLDVSKPWVVEVGTTKAEGSNKQTFAYVPGRVFTRVGWRLRTPRP